LARDYTAEQNLPPVSFHALADPGQDGEPSTIQVMSESNERIGLSPPGIGWKD
jgi:hypothetical protein